MQILWEFCLILRDQSWICWDFSSTGFQDLSEVLCSTDRILLGVETQNG